MSALTGLAVGLAGIAVYAAVCAINVFFAWVLLCLYIVFLRCCNFSNAWGEVFELAKNRGNWNGFNVIARIPVMSRPMCDELSPYLVALAHLLLYSLLAAFLGMLMTVLNLRFQKNIGTAVVLLIVMTNRVLTEATSDLRNLDRIWELFYPVRIASPMTRFTLLKYPLWQHTLYGVIYYIAGMAVIWIIGKRIIKKVDFSHQ